MSLKIPDSGKLVLGLLHLTNFINISWVSMRETWVSRPPKSQLEEIILIYTVTLIGGNIIKLVPLG